MFHDYPVFRKDFRRLVRSVAAVLVLQAFLVAIAGIRPLSDVMPLASETWFWFPKLQTVFSMLIALAAAGHLLAEERETGTDRFLFRLAATRKRVFGEKLAAGASIVLLTLLLQFVWGLLIGPIVGIDFWHPNDTAQIAVSLLSTTGLAYLIGLPLSLYFRRSIHVLLAGMIPSLAALWLIQIPWSGLAPETPYALYILGAVGIPIAALVLGGTITGRRFPVISGAHGQALSLLAKQTREKTFLYLVLAVVLALAVLTTALKGRGDTGWWILALPPAFVLTVVLGIATYTREEKTAGNSVLYHHPASRSRIFWTKFLHGLFPVLLLCAVLAALAYPLLESSGHAADWEYLLPAFSSLIMWVLIAYSCGALFTHAFVSPGYGTMAALLSFPLIIVVFIYLRVLPTELTLAHWDLFQYGSSFSFSPDEIAWLSVFPLPLFLIAIGLALSAWQVATDRRVLTGGVFIRFTSVIRLFLFALAVVTVLTKVGWRDLLYLITNIDLGAG